MKNKKGITLIALIITIIVMLILVGVTINIAINGGLFDTARDAGTGMQKAAEQEELSMAAISAYDERTGSIDISKLEAAINDLETNYEKDTAKTTSAKYVVSSPKTGAIWQIDLKTGEVTEYQEQLGPWAARGLTSSDIVYDTPYTYDYGEGELIFTILSDGGINLFGEVIPSSSIQAGYEGGAFAVSSNQFVIVEDDISFTFGYDETIGNILTVTGLMGNNPLIFYIKPNLDTLNGLIFECPALVITPAATEYYSETYGDNFNAETYRYMISFGESSCTLQAGGTIYNGTYSYNSNTHMVSITVTMDGQDQAVPATEIHSIMQNGVIINNYFIFGGDTILTTNGCTGLLAFYPTGEFIEVGGTNTVEFSVEESTGYGIVRYNNSVAHESYYCFVKQPEASTNKIYEMHATGCEARDISYHVDSQTDEIITITINGITYEPST